MTDQGQAVTEKTHILWATNMDDLGYADLIFLVGEEPPYGVGINCGGRVIVKPLRDWHAAALASEPVAGTVEHLPVIPDDDADFTPDLARKIIAKYQDLLRRAPPAPAGREAPLDLAWEAINALGGSDVQNNSYDQGLVDGIAKALEAIEKLGGEDPLPKRNGPAVPPQERGADGLKWLREAFDGDSVPKKNIALRRAHDEIVRLSAPSASSEAPSSVSGGVPTEAELTIAYQYLLEKPSTSYIQRKMGIGYNRASAIMETLENEGAVTKADKAGRRSTLPRADRGVGS